MLAPQLVGYLYDNVDPRWFLYLGVVSSGGVLLFAAVFQIVLLCWKKFNCDGVEQKCEIPLAETEPADI